MYDLSGKFIETWNQNNFSHNFGIDYPAALYILNIRVNGEIWQEKLIKY
ncbi:MAG: T9SS type A sorting domain-containing protein [Crocinitomicaceae bacterium]|nr:T9SS type A sorting domain-containing protein [Crocinitomicaceae bacterium]